MIVSLEVKSGPSAGKGVRLQSGQSISVGRTQKSDFRIPEDGHISGLHFAVSLDETACHLRDLNSRNGTLLNGQKVGEAVLESGDMIIAGETAFVVLIYQDAPTPPPVDVAAALSRVATPQERLLALLRNDYQPLYAVLDAARDIRILALLMQSKEEHQSLYEGVQGEKLSQVAPYLVRLDRGSLLLGSLLLEGWGKSWGVYLTCAAELAEVRRHLRRFLEVQLPDGKQVYFRFYDPRVLRVYLPTCTAEETIQFFGPIKHYLAEDEKPEMLLQFTNTGGGAEKLAIDLSPPEKPVTEPPGGETQARTIPMPQKAVSEPGE